MYLSVVGYILGDIRVACIAGGGVLEAVSIAYIMLCEFFVSNLSSQVGAICGA
jgi:hypothetical protein